MNALTQRHRAQQLLLRRQTVAQVGRLWPMLEWERLDESYPAFAVAVAGLVAKNRLTSAGIAAQYVRAFRLDQGVRSAVRPVLAQRLNVEQFGATLHSTSVAPVKVASGRGDEPEKAMTAGLSLTQGSMARLVLDAGRQTVTETVSADPKARGWQRVLGGSGCEFCRMLAGRGAVYSEDTATFEAHGRCGCTAEPVYG